MHKVTNGEASSVCGPDASPAMTSFEVVDKFRLQAGGGGNSPRVVIRGETGERPPRLYIDWVAFTLPCNDGPRLKRWVIRAIRKYLPSWQFEEKRGPGALGYRESFLLTRNRESFGRVCWGGNGGTSHAWLSGLACSALPMNFFYRLFGFLSRRNAKLTRVDIAADFFDGEWPIAEALSAYIGDHGAFTTRRGGRKPKLLQIGNWVTMEDGLTLVIGSRAAGKVLRVYEKGKQLGDPASPWVRYEVELRSKDRVLPAQLVNPDYWVNYFAGSFPFLEQLVDGSPFRLGTRSRTHFESLRSHFVSSRSAARNQYGPFIFWMRRSGFSSEQIVNQLSRNKEWPAAERFPECGTLSFDELAKLLGVATGGDARGC